MEMCVEKVFFVLFSDESHTLKKKTNGKKDVK